MSRFPMISLLLVLVAGCHPSAVPVPPMPPAPPPPAPVLPVFGDLADRCEVDEATGSLLLDGPGGARLVRLTDGRDVASFAPPRTGSGATLLDGRVILPGARSFVVVDPGSGDGRDVSLPTDLEPPLGVVARTSEVVLWSRAVAGPVVAVDPSTGALLRLLGEQPEPLTGVALGPRGKVITADATGWVRVWGPDLPVPDTRVRPFGPTPVSIVVVGERLAVIAAGDARIYDLLPFRYAGALRFPAPVVAAATTVGVGAGPTLVVALADGRVLRVDPLSGTVIGGAQDPAPSVSDLCASGGGDPRVVVVGTGGESAARVYRVLAFAPAEGRVGWDPPAADPVEALSSDTFAALHLRIRCAQQRGDARDVVRLLEGHGIPDLAAWAHGVERRLEEDRELLLRLTRDSLLAPCP